MCPLNFPYDWLSQVFEGEKVRNFPHLAEFSRGKERVQGQSLWKNPANRASILPRMALNTLERRNVPQIHRVLEGLIRFVAHIALPIS